MRCASVILILLLLSGCGNGLGPAGDLSGTWAATFPFPGSSLVLTLTQFGAGVTGTGTYVMEAGPGGSVQVVGTYHKPSVSLTLHFNLGTYHKPNEAYVGTLLDDSHITGALGTFSLPLVRR